MILEAAVPTVRIAVPLASGRSPGSRVETFLGTTPSHANGRSGIVRCLDSLTVAGAAPALLSICLQNAPTSRFIP
jgi:hypothetical protein